MSLSAVKKDNVKEVMISGEGAFEYPWSGYGRAFFLERKLNEKKGVLDIRMVSHDYNFSGKHDKLFYGIFGEKRIKRWLRKEGRAHLF